MTVAIGDVNGDGRPDVVVGLSGVGIQLFAQAADGTLGAPVLVPSVDSHKIAIGELHTSGGSQVAGIGRGTDTVTIFADTGPGLQAARTYPARHDGWDDIEAGDVTGDWAHWKYRRHVRPGPGAQCQRAPGARRRDVRCGGRVFGRRQPPHAGCRDRGGDRRTGRPDVVATYGGNSPNGRLGIFAQTPTGTLDDLPIPYRELRHPGRGRGRGRQSRRYVQGPSTCSM